MAVSTDINRGTSGVDLPAAVSNEIWTNLVEQSAVMQAARRITLPGAGVSIPMVTALPTAAWVDEAEEKPVSRGTVDNKTMTPYTLAVITPFSNQFKRDLPGLYDELVRQLPAALAAKFDSTVYGGTAPGGNFDTLTSAPSLTVDATGTFADLAAVVNAVAAQGATLTHWLASPSLAGLLLTAVDSLGHQFFVPGGASTSAVGSVFGAPVISSRTTMPSGTTSSSDKIGYAGDWANSAVYGTVSGVQISVSDQATLTDNSAPLNLWQRNMFAVRAEIEVGFRVKNVNHFVSLNDGTAD